LVQFLFGAFVFLAFGWLVRESIGEHRKAMLHRARLLDEALDLLGEPVLALSPDKFPVVTGCIEDGRQVRLELVADTMVTRRLPQLWLMVTVTDKAASGRPMLGALARPTGSEYYSLVHGMPEWLAPPDTDISLLMRGDGRQTPAEAAAVRAHFQGLFANPLVKEAVIASRATRIIIQASQGERGAHMILRQAKFSLDSVSATTIREGIQMAVDLGSVLPDPIIAREAA
jgi:hypothetical protein